MYFFQFQMNWLIFFVLIDGFTHFCRSSILNHRVFPGFWLELEAELAENNGLNQVKSVLTVLGYLTRSSMATIKTKKKIDSLEIEYMKLRSNVNKFESLCERFPDLKVIDSFTPGLVAILTNIVHHINRNGKSMVDENEELIILKLVELGKEVFLLFLFLISRFIRFNIYLSL